MNRIPVHPLQVFIGEADIVEYEEKLFEAIDLVNKELKSRLTQEDIVGNEAMIRIALPGLTQSQLLELVYKFREVGWNIYYSFSHKDGKSEPFIRIGIERSE